MKTSISNDVVSSKIVLDVSNSYFYGKLSGSSNFGYVGYMSKNSIDFTNSFKNVYYNSQISNNIDVLPYPNFTGDPAQYTYKFDEEGNAMVGEESLLIRLNKDNEDPKWVNANCTFKDQDKPVSLPVFGDNVTEGCVKK